MKKHLLLLTLLPSFIFSFGQQTLAHWNANQSVTLSSGTKVASWVSAAGAGITANAPSEAFAPDLIVGDSSLNVGNSVAFGPSASSIRYLTFPNLVIDTTTIFLVGNVATISNHIHFFIAGGGQSAPYGGGLWLSGTQSNIPGFGWQGSAGAIRQSNTEPTGWGVYAFVNNKLFYNGVQVGYNNTQWPLSTTLNSLGGVPPGTNGISASVNYFFKGKMSELFIFKGAVSDVRIQQFSDSLLNVYNPVLSLGPDANACATTLRLEPQNGHTFKTYLWNTGATTRELNISTNGTYWLQTTSFGKTQRDTIIVSGLTPKPVITPSVDQHLCLNRDSIMFVNLTSNPNFQFTWSTGESADTIYSSSSQPIFLSALNVNNGCVLYSDTVDMLHKVKADFNNTPVCPGVEAALIDLSVDFMGDTVNTWSWNFGDPSTTADVSTDSIGYWTYANSGSYPVYLKVTSSDGCADSLIKNLTVKPTAVPNFNWQGACYGKPTQFFDQSVPESGTQVTGYQWTFGPGILSSFVNPAVVFDTGNVYTVTLKIYTASGCNETISQQVAVNKGVNAAFAIADSLCAKQDVNVVDQSQGINDNITTWLWRFGSNTPVMGQNPSYSFQNTGNRVVRLTTTTAAGCTDSVQKTVYVRPTPNADFSFAVNGGNPPFLPQVINLSSDADHVLWNFGSGFSDTTSTPTLPIYADTGIYTISLAVQNNEGCTDTVSKNFVVFTGDRTLQLISATCVSDGDFMTYTARVFNKGALEVEQITFGANTDYNSVIQENWMGLLMPGQILDYTLHASSKYYTDANFCCVRIESFNDTLKVQAPDDEICLPLTNGTWFSAAYPTPSSGIVTVDFTFPFADTYSASLYEADGKLIRTLFTEQNVAAGVGSFSADISDLRAGMYIIRFSYRDKFYSVKLVKQ